MAGSAPAPDVPMPSALSALSAEPGGTRNPYCCASAYVGLAITAEIASAHGGTAHAAPNHPQGPRITLALPVTRRLDPDPDLAAALT